MTVKEYKSDLVKNSDYFMDISVTDAHQLYKDSVQKKIKEPFIIYVYRDDQLKEVRDSFEEYSAFVNKNKIPTYAVNLSKGTYTTVTNFNLSINIPFFCRIFTYINNFKFPSPFISDKVTLKLGDIIKLPDFLKPEIDKNRFVYCYSTSH